MRCPAEAERTTDPFRECSIRQARAARPAKAKLVPSCGPIPVAMPLIRIPIDIKKKAPPIAKIGGTILTNLPEQARKRRAQLTKDSAR
jgi:hypothetical protein